MAEQDPYKVVLRYTSASNAWLPGVPARDIKAHDVEDLDLDVDALISSGLYSEPGKGVRAFAAEEIETEDERFERVSAEASSQLNTGRRSAPVTVAPPEEATEPVKSEEN